MMTRSSILSPESMLSVKALSVSFRQHQQVIQAVNTLSFEVKKGETLAIVGESGSGKSVTSLSLMRLIEQGGGTIDHGEIWLRRRDDTLVNMVEASVTTLRRIRGGDMAMVFQEPMTSLNPVFPVGEQIAESVRLHQRKDHQAARVEALHMLDLVRMPDARGVYTRYPHQLSGGQRQRIMIAMAICCRPGMLIADEPTTALDVTVQAQILQLIRELQQELQMGVLFITHDMGVVAEIADRVLVMQHGNQVESATSEKLFSAPQQPYTQALLAAIPRPGAMKGTLYPQYFPLPGESQQPGIQHDTVLHSGSPLLEVRGLVTRFPLRGGILNRVQRCVHAVEI
ncbi:MAG: Glutathione import ATP-binding protein GsiA [Candidatus Erwinia impunctatus]|nr:Glutathione import ATP-binding protein GsiA [Culicoides impunctatus]